MLRRDLDAKLRRVAATVEQVQIRHRQPIGSLVTLDKVYELVEGNLTTEKRTDIHDISQRSKNDGEDQGWTLRVAKVICLLSFVRDLPRTEANIAAFLVDEVGKPAPKALSEIYKKLYGNVVPDLYPKLEMGSRPLKSDEAEQILKAADLKALPRSSTMAKRVLAS